MDLRGKLLVAAPALVEPHFWRTVVLVAEHGTEGAMGIILNRPSEATVADAIPGLAHLVEDAAVVHVGGPVQPEAVTVLAEFEEPEEAASIVVGNVGFLPGDGDLDLLAGVTGRTRVFAGYAGWSEQQLESELAEDDCIVADPIPEDVYSAAREQLWSEVLRRKGGAFALVATIPPDPSLN